MEEETLYERITSLPKWEAFKDLVGISYNRKTEDYMYPVKFSGTEFNGINGLHFYNAGGGLTDIDFVAIYNNATSCVLFKRHYNVPKDKIIEHIERVLEITL